jgi:putative membrane protein
MLILKWLLCAGALMLVAQIFRGIWVKSFGSALLASLVIGLLMAFVRPLLVILTIPITIVTLGLFIFLLNGFLFWLAGKMLGGFEVRGGCAAIGGAVVYSLLVMGIDHLLA